MFGVKLAEGRVRKTENRKTEKRKEKSKDERQNENETTTEHEL